MFIGLCFKYDTLDDFAASFIDFYCQVIEVNLHVLQVNVFQTSWVVFRSDENKRSSYVVTP